MGTLYCFKVRVSKLLAPLQCVLTVLDIIMVLGLVFFFFARTLETLVEDLHAE